MEMKNIHKNATGAELAPRWYFNFCIFNICEFYTGLISDFNPKDYSL